MHPFIALWLIVVFSGFGTASAAADDWVQKVVAETEGLLTGRCVSPSSPNSVYVLNATSGEHMSPGDERRAVNELTSALRAKGWMQVIHGSALPSEAYTRENNPEGRQQMYDLLTRLSDATVTIFVVPLRRGGNDVQAEVVFLARGIDNDKTHLTCAYGINVGLPAALAVAPPLVTPPTPSLVPVRQSICAPTTASLVVANVNAYATLRSGTSYHDPVVGQVSLGIGVEYSGTRRLSKPAKAGYCDELCRGAINGALDGSQKSALASCIDDDVFWFKVRTTSGQLGWMSGKYLRIAQSRQAPVQQGTDYPPVGVENGCRVILDPHGNDFDAAATFVELYYGDLSARRVRCAESRWLDPPDDLAEMIVEFVSARLSYNELDRTRSGRDRAFVDVVAHIGTTDGQQNAWRVTLTLVASRTGWLIEEMNGYQM